MNFNKAWALTDAKQKSIIKKTIEKKISVKDCDKRKNKYLSKRSPPDNQDIYYE